MNAFGKLIMELTLKGKESRMRTRLFKSIETHCNDVLEHERRTLIEQYANRHENGDFVFLDDEKNTVSIKEEFYMEYETLLNEYFYIDHNESNKDMLLAIAKVMLAGDFDVTPDIAYMYDGWCNEFEQVIEHYEKNENA